jgi:hypothetical protein
VVCFQKDLVTTSLVSCPQLDGIFTGDSEGSLRYWNMNGNPQRSNYLCGPYRKYASYWNAIDVMGKSEERKSYQRIDYSFADVSNNAMRIQIEKRPNVPEPEMQTVPYVSDCHRDAITDLIAVGTDQLVSSGRDGVIKIWKVT